MALFSRMFLERVQHSIGMFLGTGNRDGCKKFFNTYNARDVSNADEMRLFYKALPTKTATFKEETCTSGKQSGARYSAGRCQHRREREVGVGGGWKVKTATLLQRHAKTACHISCEPERVDDASHLRSLAVGGECEVCPAGPERSLYC